MQNADNLQFVIAVSHVATSAVNVSLLMRSELYRPTDSTQGKNSYESVFYLRMFLINNISSAVYTDCVNTKKCVFTPLNNYLP